MFVFHRLMSMYLLQPEMKCYKEEIFGPVLLAMTADSLEEVRMCCKLSFS